MSDLLQKIQAAVPPGYRAVDYRKPKKGEEFLNSLGNAQLATFDLQGEMYIIIEREIVWPDWIKSGCWLAMDSNGDWCLHTNEPHVDASLFMCNYGRMIVLDSKLVDTSWLPTNIEWKDSKRQKP